MSSSINKMASIIKILPNISDVMNSIPLIGTKSKSNLYLKYSIRMISENNPHANHDAVSKFLSLVLKVL
jgi:hypothetical protein